MRELQYWWTIGITLCLGQITAQSQRGQLTQEDAETLLETAAEIREKYLKAAREVLPQTNNLLYNLSLTGLRSHELDVLQLIKDFRIGGDRESPCSCSVWGKPIAVINDRVRATKSLDSIPKKIKQSINDIPEDYASVVLSQIKSGSLKPTSRLLGGILNDARILPSTPDVIEFAENIGAQLSEKHVIFKNISYTEGEVLEDLLKNAVTSNRFEPETNYQILQLLSSLKSLRRTVFPPNLLHLMKPDEYPPDVIQARDDLMITLQNGLLPNDINPEWSSPDENLLAQLTSLTRTPYENVRAIPVHVVFAHFRMKYLAFHGYSFVPDSLPDIAFLLNSFLTLRTPILIKEMYNEFSRPEFPWQSMIADLDFNQYSSPRTLLLDILREILRHPKSLKLCNTILFNYFLKADENTTPEWLQMVFPNKTSELSPIVIEPPESFRKEPPNPDCPDDYVTIIDPECLLEIIGPRDHIKFIANIIKYNPVLAKYYRYHTRQAAFLAILDDLKSDKYTDEVTNFAITQAVLRIPINEKGKLPLEFVQICPKEIERLRSMAPKVLHEPSTTTKPMPDYYKEEPSEEDSIDEPSTQDEPLDPNCEKIKVIDQASLIDIAVEKKIKALKDIVYLTPVFYEDYRGIATRKEVLKKVLLDRRELLNDEVVNFIVDRAISRLKMSWKGELPPVVAEVCEGSLKYNVTAMPVRDAKDDLPAYPELPCTNEKTIDPYSIIDILPRSKHTKLIQKIILSKPLLAVDYANYNTRKGIFKAALLTRVEDFDQYEVIFTIKKAVRNLPLNWKQSLPPVFLDICPKDDGSDDDNDDEDLSDDDSSGDSKERPTSDETTQESTFKSDELLDDENKSKEEEDSCEENSNEESCEENDDMVAEGNKPYSNIERPLSENQVKEIPKNSEESCEENEESQKCPDGEVLAQIVKIDSLWSALCEKAPEAPYIRNKLQSYIVPMEEGRVYRKGEVLENLLDSVKDVLHDRRVLANLEKLVACIRLDGPALDPPEVLDSCLPESLIVGTEHLNCRESENLVNAVRIETLYSALAPNAPKTPYIRSKLNAMLIPIGKNKIPSKGQVLKEILLKLRNEVIDRRVVRNIDILVKSILNDGPALKAADIIEVCVENNFLTTTETITPPPRVYPVYNIRTSPKHIKTTQNPVEKGSTEEPKTTNTKTRTEKPEESCEEETEPNLTIKTTEEPFEEDITTQATTTEDNCEEESETTTITTTSKEEPCGEDDGEEETTPTTTEVSCDDDDDDDEGEEETTTIPPPSTTTTEESCDEDEEEDKTQTTAEESCDEETSKTTEESCDEEDETTKLPTTTEEPCDDEETEEETTIVPTTTEEPCDEDEEKTTIMTTTTTEEFCDEEEDEETTTTTTTEEPCVEEEDTSTTTTEEPCEEEDRETTTMEVTTTDEPCKEEDTTTTTTTKTTTEEPCEEETTLRVPTKTTTEGPCEEDDTMEETTTEMNQATTKEPCEEDITTEKPCEEDLTTAEPCEQDPTTGEPREEDPTTEEPCEEDPTTEEPCEEDPTTEETPEEETPTTESTQSSGNCPINMTETEVIVNDDIVDLLPSTELYIRERLISRLIQVEKYGNLSSWGVLEALLNDLEVEQELINSIKDKALSGFKKPNRTVVCLPKGYTGDYYPPDEADQQLKEPTECENPEDVIDVQTLLSLINSTVLPQTQVIISIILNSTIPRSSYINQTSTHEILTAILKKMEAVVQKAINKLTTMGSPLEELNSWLAELQILLQNISEGEGNDPPSLVKRCLTLNNSSNTPVPTNYSDMYKVMKDIVQNPSLPKRKIKKTTIIYNTLETINVNIQAAKEHTNSTTAEDVERLSVQLAEDDSNGDDKLTQGVAAAVDGVSNN